MVERMNDKYFFNPLKKYDNNVELIQKLIGRFFQSQDQLTIAGLTKIKANFTNSDYYNFWLLYLKKRDLFSQFYNRLLPTSLVDNQLWFKSIEGEYINTEEPIYKSCLMMFMSRCADNLSIFGGPYNSGPYKVFDSTFKDEFLRHTLKLNISFQDTLNFKDDFFLQYIPPSSNEVFDELFEEGLPMDTFNKMNRCLIISENERFSKSYDCQSKLEIEGVTLLLR